MLTNTFHTIKIMDFSDTLLVKCTKVNQAMSATPFSQINENNIDIILCKVVPNRPNIQPLGSVISKYQIGVIYNLTICENIQADILDLLI